MKIKKMKIKIDLNFKKIKALIIKINKIVRRQGLKVIKHYLILKIIKYNR